MLLFLCADTATTVKENEFMYEWNQLKLSIFYNLQKILS